jgi:hypothetical protein
MERGEQVANGSMGWRGWQHEMQRARGFVPEHEEGLRVRTRGWGRGGFEGAPESHTSLRLGRGAPVDQAAVAPARCLSGSTTPPARH